jgi:hypothetical protein
LPDAFTPQEFGLRGRRAIRLPKRLDRASELVLTLSPSERERAPVTKEQVRVVLGGRIERDGALVELETGGE